jgi:ABC-type transport system involved in cytochrome c biogenesis ATPase subunit
LFIRSPTAENFNLTSEIVNAQIACTPATSCNGNGFCFDDSEIDACHCVGYTGRYCDKQMDRNNLLWIGELARVCCSPFFKIIFQGIALGFVIFIFLFIMYELWQRQRSAKVKAELAVDAGDVEDDERAKLIRSPSSDGALMTFLDVFVDGRVNHASGGEKKSGKQNFLKCFCADFVPASLTAILGGSGAGKSSLLAALIGDLPFDGRVMIDGRDVREYRSLFRDKVGFVPQQESLFEAMTVRENVQLAADLRLGGLLNSEGVFSCSEMVGSREHDEKRAEPSSRCGDSRLAALAGEALASDGDKWRAETKNVDCSGAGVRSDGVDA